MSDYPTWDQRFAYLLTAEAGLAKVRADVDAADTNMWMAIDVTIAELHKLRNAAGSEQRRSHDAMVARMEAEEAARLARPAEPTPEVLAEAQKLAGLGHPEAARLTLHLHSSMSLAAAAEVVEALTGGTDSEVPHV